MRHSLTDDQLERLLHIAQVTRRLDGCPLEMIPDCGDLLHLELVTVHDYPMALMLWVEPTTKGWQIAKQEGV